MEVNESDLPILTNERADLKKTDKLGTWKRLGRTSLKVEDNISLVQSFMTEVNVLVFTALYQAKLGYFQSQGMNFHPSLHWTCSTMCPKNVPTTQYNIK